MCLGYTSEPTKISVLLELASYRAGKGRDWEGAGVGGRARRRRGGSDKLAKQVTHKEVVIVPQRGEGQVRGSWTEPGESGHPDPASRACPAGGPPCQLPLGAAEASQGQTHICAAKRVPCDLTASVVLFTCLSWWQC